MAVDLAIACAVSCFFFFAPNSWRDMIEILFLIYETVSPTQEPGLHSNLPCEKKDPDPPCENENNENP